MVGNLHGDQRKRFSVCKLAIVVPYGERKKKRVALLFDLTLTLFSPLTNTTFVRDVRYIVIVSRDDIFGVILSYHDSIFFAQPTTMTIFV